VPDKYYDVVVIGRSFGALCAAALLARRDFTVLLVGQRARPCDYSYESFTLRRSVGTLLAASSPAWRRFMGELAYSQTWKRQLRPVEPMLQVMMRGSRFEVPPDQALFGREVEREFPDVRRLVAELYGDFARVTAAADSAFDHDAVWPPGTFLERRETGRVAANLPYAHAEPHADLLAEFPRAHPYRRIVRESVRFSTDLATPPPAFAVARLHGSWTRGLVALPGGQQQLEDLLMARVTANGGQCRLDERVASVEVKRGGVAGVHIDGDQAPVGTGFVVTDQLGEEVAALSGGHGISKRAQREWPRINATTGRFVVSVVARPEGVPTPFAEEVMILPERDGAMGPLHVQRAPANQEGDVLLACELLVGERHPVPLAELRGQVVEQLCRTLPFLERHLVLVDSVHDGLPLWRYRHSPLGLERATVPRSELQQASTRAEPMRRQLEVDPPGYLGLGGEPLRGPIERTLLVGPSVLPGLGQEGRLLAAIGAARIVTQSDKRKARMRREMWTKIEIS
jgi:hypothetical protein